MKSTQAKPFKKRKILKLSQRGEKENTANENKNTEADNSVRKTAKKVVPSSKKVVVKNFPCPDCNKSYVFRSSLIFHRKSHMQYNDSFICYYCNKLFRQKISLQLHIMAHNHERPYECFLCSKKFITYSKLILHIKTHMNQKTYQCAYCDSKFIEKVNLMGHITTHANENGYIGDQLYYYDYHLPSVIKQIKGCLSNKGKMFKCYKCDKQFALRSELSEHLSTHGRDDLYKCPCCDHRYAWNSSLSRHVRTHLKTLTKCNYCNKIIKRNEHINVHTRSHTGIKPYACYSCHDLFSWRTSLRRHLTNKLMNKSIFCSVCKKYFNSKCHEHFKKPRVRQTFPCKYCDHTYSFRIQLNRHILRKHEIRNNYENYANNFSCKYCDEVFKLRFVRNIHVKNHEKSITINKRGYLFGLHYICVNCGEIHAGEKFNIFGDVIDIHNEHSYASLFEMIPNIASRCSNYNLRPTIKYKNLEYDETPVHVEESEVISDNWDTFQNVILFDNNDKNENLTKTITEEVVEENRTGQPKEKRVVHSSPHKKKRKKKYTLTLARKNLRKKKMMMKNGGNLESKKCVRKSVRKRNITVETYSNIAKQTEFKYTCRYCNSHYNELEDLKIHIIEYCTVENFIRWAVDKLS